MRMIEFFEILVNPDVPFLRLALAAGMLASFAFGIVGSFVVARKISYVAGGIAHSVLGGLGLGLFLQFRVGWKWMNPMYGAFLAAILAAFLIAYVSQRYRERADTVIGAVWSVGMAGGLLFMAKTPGYMDPMSFLFGNILLLTSGDLWMILILDAVILSMTLLYYNSLVAVSFDEEYARLRGINVELLNVFLLVMIALSVVLLIRVVGIVLVIALFTLPAAIAGKFVGKMWQMMAGAVLFCMFFTVAGLAAGFYFDLPAGPVIIVIAGIGYFLTLGAGTRKAG